MNKRFVHLCVICFGVAAAQAIPFDNSTISQTISSLGYPNAATFGQTFTAPTANVLDDWTIYLQNAWGTPQSFKFYLMAWNGSEAAGPILYQSGLETVAVNQTTFPITAFTVAPDLALTAGKQYVIFINESGLNTPTIGFINQGGNSTSTSLGGNFVYLDNGDNFSLVTTEPWKRELNPDIPETAYKADFSSQVPDSGSSIVLMSLGIGVLAAMRRCLQRLDQSAGR